MGNDVNLQIGQDVIRPIIEAKIQAAIVAELSSVKGAVIDEIVRNLLTVRVDENGKRSGYSSDRPFLEWVVKDAVMNMTKVALKETLEVHGAAIREEISKAIIRQKRSIADVFVAHLLSATEDKWRTTVNVQFEKPKSEY